MKVRRGDEPTWMGSRREGTYGVRVVVGLSSRRGKILGRTWKVFWSISVPGILSPAASCSLSPLFGPPALLHHSNNKDDIRKYVPSQLLIVTNIDGKYIYNQYMYGRQVHVCAPAMVKTLRAYGVRRVRDVGRTNDIDGVLVDRLQHFVGIGAQIPSTHARTRTRSSM